MFRSMFSKAVSKSSSRITRPAPKARLSLEALEKRDLMAGITFSAVTGIVTISGTTKDDVANVSVAGSQVNVNLTAYADVEPYLEFFSQAKSYAAADVKEVKFYGFEGKDKFNNNTAIKSYADGGLGNDQLNGGLGVDFLVGNHGNDTLHGGGGNDSVWGSGGHDQLFGNAGRDVLKGHGGSDSLYGGSNNDSLYGGSSNDRLYGESGNDVIVSIGGGNDTITGGTQWDNVWMDTTDTMTDISANETSLQYIHQVGEFFSYSYNGGGLTTPVSKELNGQDLADPLPYLTHTGLSIQNFKNNPLFASSGPTQDDVFQGSVGDCYIMGRLAAIAKANPDYIKKLVVDLGDGTYAVRFWENGQQQFVRVDADLWVDDSGTPKYAKLGQEGSTWVAIVEKAWAFFRYKMGSYPSIPGGQPEDPAKWGITTNSWEINDGVTKEEVVAWFNSGSPAGTLKNKITAGAINLMNWISTQIDAGKAISTGSRSSLSNMLAIQLDDPSTPAQESTWRRGQHIFMVDHVLTDGEGTPTGLVLRNPYGTQGPGGDGYITITDFTRIYFCIGRAVTSDTV